MKEARGEMLRAAAVPLIESDDVHAAREGLRGEPEHVVGAARPVQPVERDERHVLPRVRLPVAVRQDPRVRRDIEVATGRGGEPREVPRVPPAKKRHAMAAAKRRPGHEGVERHPSSADGP